MNKYDLIVIGAGPAGTPAAMAAAQFGKKVLLIDKRDAPGGECLFEGCIPSKVLENAANEYYKVANSELFHIETLNPQIHWEEVIKDKEMILKKRSMGALKAIEMLPNLDFKQGIAKFKDENSIVLNDEVYYFDKALIATGAKTTFPPIQGNGIDKVWTNKDIFLQKELPNELLIIGAGAISCELTQMFNKLGVKCHILQRSARILKHIPEDGALIVQNRMIESGIQIDCNVNLEEVNYENGKFIVKFTQNNESKILEYKNVLMATGRSANVDGLELEKANVEYSKKGVSVNKELQTSNPNIYACGDCIPAPKFAHTASYEAGIVVHNMFTPQSVPNHEVDYDKNSWVLFSDPQIGIAGLDEESAEKRGIKIKVEKYDYMQDARAQINKETEGFVKFIIDESSQIIIGIEIVSEDASSLIGEASLIVANKMTIMNIMNAIHPHPTLTEGFGKLAQTIFFKNMMKRRK